MNKEKLILSNEKEIEIESGSSLSDIRIISKTKDNMVTVWGMMTDSNLKAVSIQDADGGITGNYSDLILVNETSTIQADGTILTSFNLRKKTEVELLREEVNELKKGYEVHTGAIDDLGVITSALAEAQEGGVS